jgi:hypothetical protein
MIGFVRLVVCGGLFAAGYYLGRQSCRLESEQDQSGLFEDPDAVPESMAVDPDEKQAGG